MVRSILFGLSLLVLVASTAAQAQMPHGPARPMEQNLVLYPGDHARLVDPRSGRPVRVSCEDGYPSPEPGPAPAPSKVCSIAYNDSRVCGLYTVLSNGSPIAGCIGSPDDAIAKLNEFVRSGLCVQDNWALPTCELKYNDPKVCGLYSVSAGGAPITGCIGSSEDATRMIEKFRNANVCR